MLAFAAPAPDSSGSPHERMPGSMVLRPHGDRLMDRRVFMGHLALATLALPRATVAQPARTMFRIGILSSRYSTSDVAGSQPSDPHACALLRGLRELGYVYGQHFVTEARGAEGKPDRFPKITAELVRLAVDVIVAGGPMLPYIK